MFGYMESMKRKIPRVCEGLLVFNVSVVEFLVFDDSGAERRPVGGIINSEGTHGRGFFCKIPGGFLGVAGYGQRFLFCYNDLLGVQI